MQKLTSNCRVASKPYANNGFLVQSLLAEDPLKATFSQLTTPGHSIMSEIWKLGTMSVKGFAEMSPVLMKKNSTS